MLTKLINFFLSLFSTKEKVKEKVKVISILDYPKSMYTAYWENCIGCDGISPELGWSWKTTIYQYGTGKILNTKLGFEPTKEKARETCHKTVKSLMEKYKRTTK